MTNWERNAIFCQDEYDTYVNLKERYYICPFCGEPVYEEDGLRLILATSFVLFVRMKMNIN